MNDTQHEKSISTRYPKDVLEAMKALAEQHERSFNGEVIWALRFYIEHCRRVEEADIVIFDGSSQKTILFEAKHIPRTTECAGLFQKLQEDLPEITRTYRHEGILAEARRCFAAESSLEEKEEPSQ